jgi:hypothetical protein
MEPSYPTLDKLSLSSLLSRFQPIGISEMDHANLQNRKESKYLLTTKQALHLLSNLPETYRIFNDVL